jgi:hypothetical protein
MLKYDTHEQAEMRLSETILTYKDQAVYVRRIRPATTKRGMMADVTVLPWYNENGTVTSEDQQTKMTIALDDPDLNFRKFNVGYCNDYSRKAALFLGRMPNRQQKQGLTPRGLTSTAVGRYGGGIPETTTWGRGFPEMLQGVYPSTGDAINWVAAGDWQSVGISNQFAVERDKRIKGVIALMYRNIPVGVALGKNVSHFILDDDFNYLREVLTEEKVPFILEGSNG